MREGAGDTNEYDIAAAGLEKATAIAVKWSNAVDTVQYTSAKANYEAGVNDVVNRAANDPDYNNSDTYVKELEELKKENLKGFSNKNIQSRAALDFEYGNQAAEIKIGNAYKKKVIAAGQVATFKLLDLEASNYVNSVGERGKIVAAAKIKNIIDAQVAAGVFGEKEGHKLYESTIKEAQVAIEDEEDLKQKQEKEAILAHEIARNETEDTMAQLRINMQDSQSNEVTDSDLINLARSEYEAGNISERFARVFVNSLKSVKVADPSNIDSINKYNELDDRKLALKDRWFRPKTPFEAKAQYRADVLQAEADGFLTKKERTELLEDTYDKLYDDPKVRDAMKQVIAQSSLYATQDTQARVKAKMRRGLMEKIIDGKSPNDALEETIREQIIDDLEKPSQADEFGFVVGEKRNGYTYIGNNKWRK